MTTSEPTTGELIEALRCDGVIKPCEGCFFAFQIENCAAMGCRTDDMFGLAADRLESQDRMIQASFRIIKSQETEIEKLTARAEQAERERDAAFDLLQDMRGCDECKHLARTWREEPCNRCCMEYSFFEPCEQPQEGEGV